MSSAQSMYVALLGRPGDPGGLAYFNDVTKNGSDYGDVDTLLSSPEFYHQFGDQVFDYAGAFVDFYYERLFGRHANADEQRFFENYAASHGILARAATLGIAIMEAAQGSDLAVMQTKIATADRFTTRIDTSDERALYTGDYEAGRARVYLSTVDVAHVPTDHDLDMYISGLGAAHGATIASVIGTASTPMPDAIA